MICYRNGGCSFDKDFLPTLLLETEIIHYFFKCSYLYDFNFQNERKQSVKIVNQ